MKYSEVKLKELKVARLEVSWKFIVYYFFQSKIRLLNTYFLLQKITITHGDPKTVLKAHSKVWDNFGQLKAL